MYFDVPTRKPKYRNYVSYAIDDQTIHFWNLQLQFMEVSSYALKELFKSLDFVGMYSVNKHTTKIESLVYCSDSYKPLSENDHNCLATHLALNLSGLIDE